MKIFYQVLNLILLILNSYCLLVFLFEGEYCTVGIRKTVGIFDDLRNFSEKIVEKYIMFFYGNRNAKIVYKTG